MRGFLSFKLKDTRRAGSGRGRFGDPGRVPLGLRKNAKGGVHGTQLASLRQVSHVLQRILPRAKRKPAPVIKAVRARNPPGAVYWRE